MMCEFTLRAVEDTAQAFARRTLKELVRPDAAAVRGHVVDPRQINSHEREQQQYRAHARLQLVRSERAQLNDCDGQCDRVLRAAQHSAYERFHKRT